MKLRTVVIALVVLVVLDAAACLTYDWSVKEYVRRPAAERKFDVVVIFAAESGTVGYRFHPLLAEGARLTASGAAARLICAGGNRPATGRRGCEEAAKWLVARGVPAERILVDTVSRDTIGNAREAARLGRAAGARSAILLSYSWHAPRVRSIAAAEWPEAETFSMSPPLDEWSRGRYAWDSWRAIHHEWVAWTIWKVLGERALTALVSVLRP